MIASLSDINLKNKVKEITAWHLIKLANPNINMQLFRTGYEDAIAWLKDVQKGNADPDGWPYKDDDEETNFPEGNTISYTSNPKRENHY